MSKFKDKVLSKSGQFKFYKENYERLSKENKELKCQINLSEELEKTPIIKELLSNARSFSNWKYLDYYFRDDFEKILGRSLKGLSSEDKVKFKLIFLRALMGAYTYRQTLYSEEEIKLNKEIKDFKAQNSSNDKICDFNIVPNNNYNITCFMCQFSYEDKTYLQDKDIIDAGAFIGDSALPLSKLTNKNVYSFEPFNESYKIMEENIKLNNIKNIVPVKASLTDSDGEMSLYLSGNNLAGITSDSNMRKYDEEIKVKSRSLDSFVNEHNLNVGFIKIDVEGGEQALLEGAINTIKKFKPIIYVSIYHKADDFFKIKPWIDSLNLGYEFKISKEQPYSFIADTVLECRPKYDNNASLNVENNFNTKSNFLSQSNNFNSVFCSDDSNSSKDYKLLSVIIPVYNSEKYLKKSINSVINQSIGFDNIELICVDDYSTDNSSSILDDYSNKYDNIKVIHLDTNSKYAGRPRNIGIEHVTTDYIMFLDSDDYYTSVACEGLYNAISKDNSIDVVFGEHINKYPNTKEKVVNHICNKNLILDKNSKELFELTPAIQTKIYRADFIKNNNIKFPEGIPGEDLVFSFNVLSNAKMLYLNNFNVFDRIIRDNSSVSFNIGENYLLGLINAYKLSLDVCFKQKVKIEFINLLLVNHLSFFTNQLLRSESNLNDIFSSKIYEDFKNHTYFDNNFEFKQLFINLDNCVYDNLALLNLIEENINFREGC